MIQLGFSVTVVVEKKASKEIADQLEQEKNNIVCPHWLVVVNSVQLTSQQKCNRLNSQ